MKRLTQKEQARLRWKSTIREQLISGLLQMGIRVENLPKGKKGQIIREIIEELRREGRVFERQGAVWMWPADHQFKEPQP